MTLTVLFLPGRSHTCNVHRIHILQLDTIMYVSKNYLRHRGEFNMTTSMPTAISSRIVTFPFT